jgi:hypothetical protein
VKLPLIPSRWRTSAIFMISLQYSIFSRVISVMNLTLMPLLLRSTYACIIGSVLSITEAAFRSTHWSHDFCSLYKTSSDFPTVFSTPSQTWVISLSEISVKARMLFSFNSYKISSSNDSEQVFHGSRGESSLLLWLAWGQCINHMRLFIYLIIISVANIYL